jgi:hypothetical protein
MALPIPWLPPVTSTTLSLRWSCIVSVSVSVSTARTLNLRLEAAGSIFTSDQAVIAQYALLIFAIFCFGNLAEAHLRPISKVIGFRATGNGLNLAYVIERVDDHSKYDFLPKFDGNGANSGQNHEINTTSFLLFHQYL